MTKSQRDRLRHPQNYCPSCRCSLRLQTNGSRLCTNHLCPHSGRPIYPVRPEPSQSPQPPSEDRRD